MRKDVRDGDSPRDDRCRWSRSPLANGRKVKIYVLGRDTLALVGRDEWWEVGIVVTLGHAVGSTMISGKRRRARILAGSMISTSGYRFKGHLPCVVQLDVSLVYSRRRQSFKTAARCDATIRSQSRGAVGPVSSVSPVATSPVPLTIAPSPIGQFINALEPVKEEAAANTSSTVDTTVNIGASSTARSSIESLSSPSVTGSLAPEQPTGCEANDVESVSYELPVDASVPQTNAWLRARRFHAFQATFASFSAGDILRLSRDDLIQICGLADGIRLFNALHSKAPTPKLTLYFAVEGSGATPWRVIYLENLNSALLASKLLATLNLSHDRLHSVLIQGPQGVHVLVSNELVANIKDESMYLVEIIKDCASERYKLLLKPSSPR